MKEIINKWWDYDTKSLFIGNYRKAWKENGNKPQLRIFENGGRRRNGDSCFDLNIILGYLVISYTNWDLQGATKQRRKETK